MTSPATSAAGWRPKQAVRVIAIALDIREGRILVAEVLADDGAVKGWRPPGGGVEFGETAAAALSHEIREEFGCDVQIEGAPLVLENLYEHEGAQGHEIVFAFRATLAQPIFEGRRSFLEDSGCAVWAEWLPVGAFSGGGRVLYPDGLSPALAG